MLSLEASLAKKGGWLGRQELIDALDAYLAGMSGLPKSIVTTNNRSKSHKGAAAVANKTSSDNPVLKNVQRRASYCTAFWLENETDRLRPVKLWESVDKLLGRGLTQACSSIDVESLNDFVEKVSKVRATKCGAPSPMFSAVRDGVSLPHFSAISVDDVIRSTRQLLDKSSAAEC